MDFSDIMIFFFGFVATGAAVGPYIALMMYDDDDEKEQKE
jgi:hypothetical protein